MKRRPPRSTLASSSAASDVYKRQIENTSVGTHTDSEGNYNLSIRKGVVYKVRFSFMGYESQIHELRLNGDTTLNISLLSKSYITEEVFVNATRAGERT